jgi:hypothetical protein
MKMSELNAGTEYAVVPSWTYASRGARQLDTVRENDVVKATLVNKTKYEYEASQRKSLPTDFSPSPEGTRSIGVLFEAKDNSGSSVYFTSRLADVIAPYAELEPKWSSAKKVEQEREREQRERQAKEEAFKKQVFAEVERSRNSVINTSRELLGANTYVSVDTEGYGTELKGIVKLSLTEFEALIEMAYAGKDNA